MREKNRWYLSLIACLLVVQAVVTYAAPPETVTLQGVVESSSGDPVSGTAAYRLRFYDAETGGSQLGSDFTGTTTLSSRGRFSIELAPPAAVLSASSAWYEIALDTTTPGDGVDDDDVFQDRIKLTSVPFALQTSDSNNLNGQDGNYYTNASNLVSGNLAGGRMPTGGAWTLSSDLNVVGTGKLTIGGSVVVGSYNPLTSRLRVYQTVNTNVKVIHSTIFYNGCDDTACLFSGDRFNGDTWVDTEFKVTGLGKCYADGGWNSTADYAEYFYTENLSISEGDLVSIVEKDYRAEFDAMGEIERASMFNRQDTLGIVSTNPGVTGILVPDTTEDSQVIESDPHYKTVGLLGQVPAKILFTNEVLSSGDPIAPSCLAGIGMKATQPGQIVAKALESFETSGAIDVASLDDIDWPEDDGTNPAKPCFRVPISSFGSEIQEALAADHGLQPSDHIYVGKIMVFVNVSWYDPDPDAGALERERLAAENRVLQTDISTLHDRLERLEAMLGVRNDTH